jgi:hypothetical protein
VRVDGLRCVDAEQPDILGVATLRDVDGVAVHNAHDDAMRDRRGGRGVCVPHHGGRSERCGDGEWGSESVHAGQRTGAACNVSVTIREGSVQTPVVCGGESSRPGA